MKRRITALIMTLCMVLTMLPLHVHAEDTTYTVYLNQSSMGEGTVSGSGNYAAGATVTISASPADGSCFYTWVVASGSASLSNASSQTTTFTMPAENVTITANFRYHVAGAYMNDANQHWTQCFLCSTLMSAKENHADADGNGLCDVCEYDLHTHNYSAATCTAPATCSCGDTTGGVDSSNHVGGTEIRNAKDATEFEAGYTGDTYCLGCGDKLSDGQSIPATHVHSYAAATCTAPATCSCGATTGDVDKTNHVGGTEIRNAVAAGEFTEGYTGDTYCLGCGNVISYGETIPATHTHVLEWTYDSGMHWQKCGCGESSTAAQAHQFEDDSDATCDTCGYTREVHQHNFSTATCTTPATCSCGETTGDVDKSNHVGGTEIRNAKDATEFEAGYTGDTYCLGCGNKLSDGQSIPATHVHSYAAATCTTPATCSCNATQGDVDSSNHVGGTEIRNAKDATETEDGYTGDTYCKGCGDKLAEGQTIPATHQHSYTSVVTAPTCGDKGYTTYTCSCNDSYVGDYVDALGHDWSDYVSDGNGKHARTCGNDSSHYQQVQCSDGADADELCDTCGYDLHAHSYNSYAYDRNGHWKVCSCGATQAAEDHDWYIYKKDANKHYWRCDCGNNGWSNDHFDNNDTGKCDDCGYQMSHTHDYRYLMGNNTQHWYECECGAKANIEDHSLEWRRKDAVLGDRVTISGLRIWEEGHYQACSGCNYKTAYQHHEGTCTMLTDQMLSPEQNHRIDCDICGENTIQFHYYVFLYNDTHHWKTCPCGYGFDEDTDMVAHTFATKDENGVVVTYCTGCDWQTTHAHRYTIANCVSPSICSCGKTNGEKNPNNHTGGTEIRDAAEATIVADGYTGDTYCLGCGKMLESGEVIPKVGLIFTGTDGEIVTFTPGEGLVLPEDAVLVVEPHTPSVSDLDFLLPPEMTEPPNVTQEVNVEAADIQNRIASTFTGPGEVEYTRGALLLIDGKEYYLYPGSGSGKLQLLDKDGILYDFDGTNPPESTGTKRADFPEKDEYISINGAVYQVLYSEKDKVVLYMDGKIVGEYLNYGALLLYGDDYHPDKVNERQQLSGTVTSGESPIDGLVSGKTYNVSVIGSNDISVPGYDEAVLNSIKAETEAEKAAREKVERLKADMEAKKAAVDQLDATDPDHMNAWAAWDEAETAYKEALAELAALANLQSATVTQTFDIPNELVGRTDVTFVAVHNTDPFHVPGSWGSLREDIADFIEEWHKQWEETYSPEIGTVEVSGDGQTLTATYTVSSFSPFTVYAFTEAELPEIKEFVTQPDGTLARVVNGQPVTTHTVASGENLTDIARKYGCTVDEIVALNSDLIENPSKIYVGWELVIPGK